MTLIEFCVVVIAFAIVAQSLSTVARNIYTARQLKKAENIVNDFRSQVGSGAALGALIGGSLAAAIKGVANGAAYTGPKPHPEATQPAQDQPSQG